MLLYNMLYIETLLPMGDKASVYRAGQAMDYLGIASKFSVYIELPIK